MVFERFLKTMAALTVSGIMLGASANSVGFDSAVFSHDSGQVSITVIYDFTDFAMFGGSLDAVYNPDQIEFVSYTRGPSAPDVDEPASPVGSPQAPGLYEGFGIGRLMGFAGINSAGEIGTLVFNVVGAYDPDATPCGLTICLFENDTNPFMNLLGESVGDELLMNGISGANVPLAIPVPAAVWFLLSGLAVLSGFGRRSF